MPKTKKVKSSKKNLYANLLLLTITILLCFLFLEIALRIATHQNPMHSKYHEHFVYTSNPGHTFKQFHFDKNEEIMIKVNKQAYQGPIIPYENKNNKPRIFIIGDSFVECYAPGFDACFTQQLQNALTDHEIIAMGTSSWALDNEYKVVELEGTKYKPNTVIITFFLNDFWDASRDTVFSLENDKTKIELKDNTPIIFNYKKKIIYHISEYSYLARFTLNTLNKKFSLAKIGSLLGISDFEKDRYKEELFWGVPKALFYEKEDEEIKRNYLKTSLLLEKYQSLAEKNNFHLIFAVVPLKEQVNQRKLDELKQEHNITDEEFDIHLPYNNIISLLEEKEITYVYPLEEFQKLEQEQTESSYYEIDGHLNSIGNKRFANAILKELEAKN